MTIAAHRSAIARARRSGPGQAARQRPAYRSAARRTLADAFEDDHVAVGWLGRFRWMLSTLLAALVGSGAIAAVILGSLDSLERPADVVPSLAELKRDRPQPPRVAAERGDGLSWSAPKVDKLASMSGVISAKQIIQEQFQVKRGTRTFIDNRNYVRVLAQLSTVPPKSAALIPPFNPLKLNAPVESSAQDAEVSVAEQNALSLQVNDILGGILPNEDGQEIDQAEARQIVARALESDNEALVIRPTFVSDTGADILTPRDAGDRNVRRKQEAVAANTTVIAKTVNDRDEADDLDRNEVRVVKVKRGDTLMLILQRLGADTYLAKAMSEAAKSVLPEIQLPVTYEVHITMVPTLQGGDRLEPGGYSVYAENQVHKVSVARDSSGEFVASQSPANARLAHARAEDEEQTQTSSLYASVYNSVLVQGVDPEVIQLILRIHAPETDFRRTVRPTDAIDTFFDAKDDTGAEPQPGDLLFTSLTTGGETQRYWRFRTADGVVDYYDEFGNNSRKFLMRRPVRGENVNFSSGFGMRRHPVLFNVLRPHNGIDWSATIGTPIVAAGNGVIEFAGFKGEFGNHVRLRHANGYQTTYSHMSRFGPGIREGVRVRQGQVIGFIGNTGLSAGPHLHFEVLVNNRFVDPMKIQVPRERRLSGKEATDFQRERARIEDLMRRPPLMTVTK